MWAGDRHNWHYYILLPQILFGDTMSWRLVPLAQNSQDKISLWLSHCKVVHSIKSWKGCKSYRMLVNILISDINAWRAISMNLCNYKLWQSEGKCFWDLLLCSEPRSKWSRWSMGGFKYQDVKYYLRYRINKTQYLIFNVLCDFLFYFSKRSSLLLP